MNWLLLKSRTWSFLRQAFIPLLAVILLGGHAYGQTPERVMPLDDSITDSPAWVFIQSTNSHHPRCFFDVGGLNART